MTDLPPIQTPAQAVVMGATNGLLESGWRPMIGWACVAALFYDLLARPIADWFAVNMLHAGVLEPLDTNTLFVVLGTILGVGTLRTIEKVKNVSGVAPGP